MPQLASPSEAAAGLNRSCSALLQVHEGHEFEASLAQNVTQSAMNLKAALYSPLAGGAGPYENSAFAGYQFNLAGYSGNAYLAMQWLSEPTIAKLWLGFSNWQRDRWDWYPATGVAQLDLGAGGYAPYIKPAGDPQEGLMFVVVLVTGSPDAKLLRLQAGDYKPEWIHTWGTDTEETLTSVSVDQAGSSYYTGEAEVPDSPGTYGVAIVKYNADGGLEWNKSWQGPGNYIGNAVACTATGEAYICGTSGLPGDAGDQMVLLKLGNDGILAWSKTWNSMGGIKARAITLDPGGNPIVAGSLGNRALVIKFSPDGVLTWQKTWGGTGSDDARGVAADSNSDILFTGTTAAFGEDDDVSLVRLTMGGFMVWNRVWDLGGMEHGNALTLDSSGNAYIAGVGQVPEDNSALMICYSSTGNLLLHKGYKGGLITEGNGIALLPGGIYLAGTMSGTAISLGHIMLVAYDYSGNWQSTRLFGNQPITVFYGNALAADAAGVLHIGGTALAAFPGGWQGNDWIDAPAGNAVDTGAGSELQNIGSMADASGVVVDAMGTLVNNFGVEDTTHSATDGMVISVAP